MDTVTIALPNRPVITVHKGWTISKKRGKVSKSVLGVDQQCFETNTFSISSRKGKSSAVNPPNGETPCLGQDIPATKPHKTGQRIEFINDATVPLHTKDAAVRKLVRSHVMKEVARERREQKETRLKDADITKRKETKAAEGTFPFSEQQIERLAEDNASLVLPARDQSIPSFPLGQQVDYHFTNLPTKMQINLCRLRMLYLTQVGSAMFPLEFHLAYNPPQQLLELDFSITDDAVFQSMSYATAVCSTLTMRRMDSHEVSLHTGLTINLINRLLDGEMGMADGMLGAVSCLATGEALRGHFDDWAVHMTGLKKMVEMRGGMDKIQFYMRMKLYRADLMGSIDQAIRPFFHFDRSYRPTIYSNPYLPTYDTLLDLPTFDMDLQSLLPRFADVLTELRDFSRVVELALTRDARLDLRDFIEACYSIEHQLLPSGPVDDVSDGDLIHDNDDLGEAFRLAAIIYTKEILQEFSFSATGCSILVSKLKSSLDLVLTSEAVPTSSSLVLWLLVMGGVASAKNSMDRTFFVAHLARLRRDFVFDEWGNVKERLESLLWIGRLLDKPGKRLWEEVGLTGVVLI